MKMNFRYSTEKYKITRGPVHGNSFTGGIPQPRLLPLTILDPLGDVHLLA